MEISIIWRVPILDVFSSYEYTVLAHDNTLFFALSFDTMCVVTVTFCVVVQSLAHYSLPF